MKKGLKIFVLIFAIALAFAAMAIGMLAADTASESKQTLTYKYADEETYTKYATTELTDADISAAAAKGVSSPLMKVVEETYYYPSANTSSVVREIISTEYFAYTISDSEAVASGYVLKLENGSNTLYGNVRYFQQKFNKYNNSSDGVSNSTTSSLDGHFIQNGDKYTLLADVAFVGTSVGDQNTNLDIGKDQGSVTMSFDLNGFSLKIISGTFITKDQGTHKVTVTSSKAGGEIVTNATGGIFVVYRGGLTLVVENVTIKAPRLMAGNPMGSGCGTANVINFNSCELYQTGFNDTAFIAFSGGGTSNQRFFTGKVSFKDTLISQQEYYGDSPIFSMPYYTSGSATTTISIESSEIKAKTSEQSIGDFSSRFVTVNIGDGSVIDGALSVGESKIILGTSVKYRSADRQSVKLTSDISGDISGKFAGIYHESSAAEYDEQSGYYVIGMSSNAPCAAVVDNASGETIKEFWTAAEFEEFMKASPALGSGLNAGDITVTFYSSFSYAGPTTTTNFGANNNDSVKEKVKFDLNGQTITLSSGHFIYENAGSGNTVIIESSKPGGKLISQDTSRALIYTKRNIYLTVNGNDPHGNNTLSIECQSLLKWEQYGTSTGSGATYTFNGGRYVQTGTSSTAVFMEFYSNKTGSATYAYAFSGSAVFNNAVIEQQNSAGTLFKNHATSSATKKYSKESRVTLKDCSLTVSKTLANFALSSATLYIDGGEIWNSGTYNCGSGKIVFTEGTVFGSSVPTFSTGTYDETKYNVASNKGIFYAPGTALKYLPIEDGSRYRIVAEDTYSISWYFIDGSSFINTAKSGTIPVIPEIFASVLKTEAGIFELVGFSTSAAGTVGAVAEATADASYYAVYEPIEEYSFAVFVGDEIVKIGKNGDDLTDFIGNAPYGTLVLYSDISVRGITPESYNVTDESLTIDLNGYRMTVTSGSLVSTAGVNASVRLICSVPGGEIISLGSDPLLSVGGGDVIIDGDNITASAEYLVRLAGTVGNSARVYVNGGRYYQTAAHFGGFVEIFADENLCSMQISIDGAVIEQKNTEYDSPVFSVSSLTGKSVSSMFNFIDVKDSVIKARRNGTAIHNMQLANSLIRYEGCEIYGDIARVGTAKRLTDENVTVSDVGIGKVLVGEGTRYFGNAAILGYDPQAIGNNGGAGSGIYYAREGLEVLAFASGYIVCNEGAERIEISWLDSDGTVLESGTYYAGEDAFDNGYYLGQPSKSVKPLSVEGGYLARYAHSGKWSFTAGESGALVAAPLMCDGVGAELSVSAREPQYFVNAYLGTELGINLYIPKELNVTRVTVHGREYPVSDETVKFVINGEDVECRYITVYVAANEIFLGADFKLTATETVAGEEYTFEFGVNVSVVEYAKQLILSYKNYQYQASCKKNLDLCYYLIEYLRAAYHYMGELDVDKATAEYMFDGALACLPEDYEPIEYLPESQMLEGTVGINVSVDLQATPEFIFSWSDDDGISNVYVNGERLIKYERDAQNNYYAAYTTEKIYNFHNPIRVKLEYLSGEFSPERQISISNYLYALENASGVSDAAVSALKSLYSYILCAEAYTGDKYINATYTVEYYVENLDQTDYVLYESVPFNGTVGGSVSAFIKDYEHFTYVKTEKSVEQGVAGADDSLVLKVYYKRNVYRVEAMVSGESAGGTIIAAGNYPYGTQIDVIVENKLGYELVGISDGVGHVQDKYTVEGNAVLTAEFRIHTDMDDYYFESTKDTCVITGVKDSGKTSYYIPDFVTAIGDYAFFGCDKAQAVHLGSVNKIGNYAFAYCSNLKAAEIPETVTEIFGSSFRGCAQLRAVGDMSNSVYRIESIMNGAAVVGAFIIENATETVVNAFADGAVEIPYGIRAIGEYAFSGMAITAVEIPSTVRSIGESAFLGCSLLASVNIPSGVSVIKEGTFMNCSSLKSIMLPVSVKTVEKSAFRYCYDLESAYIDGVTEICDYAFAGCTALVDVSVGSAIETVATGAFDGCTALPMADALSAQDGVYYLGNSSNPYVVLLRVVTGATLSENFTIPSGTAVICDGAFAGHSELKSVSIPNSVRSIGINAFVDCINLRSINVPDSVRYIGMGAFEGCNRLRTISLPFMGTAAGSGEIFGVIFGSQYFKEQNAKIPSALVTVEIRGGKQIPDNAFYGCEDIVNITLANELEYIGNNAFYGCDSLEYNEYGGMQFIGGSSNPYIALLGVSNTGMTSAAIPSGTKFIGSYAFASLQALKSVTIPSTVKYVEDAAFSGCVALANVTLGSGVISIGDFAFSDCFSLGAIAFPEGLQNIGSYAFFNCGSLKNIDLPDSLIGVESFAFYGCSGIETVSIGAGVRSIGDCAFTGLKSVSSVSVSAENTYYKSEMGCLIANSDKTLILGTKYGVIPEGVERIGKYAFADCDIESIVVPDSVKVICEGAFRNSKSLRSITLGAGVEQVCDFAFKGCSALDSVLLNQGVEYIGAGAFENCINIRSITIPVSVSTWGEGSFKYCTDLEYVNIENGVSSIGSSAFYGCTSLKSVILPESIRLIGGSAFLQCRSLNQIDLPDELVIIGGNAFSGCSALSSVGIPDSVLSIGDRAFNECSSLVSVSIGNSVHTVGNYAFANCGQLRSIVFGSSVRNIGNYAFHNNYMLEAPQLSENLERIGNYAFSGCYLFSSIVIPDSVTHMGTYVFENCKTLKKCTLGEGLQKISGFTFIGCVRLAEVNIPEGIYEIGASAFKNCLALENVPLHDGIRVIGDSAFYNCSALKEIYLGLGISDIQASAFRYTALTEVTIPGGISLLSDYVFANCTELTSIDIPSNITGIGYAALYNCQALRSVTIRGDVTAIGASAFKNCVALESIELPQSLKYVGEYAFRNCKLLSEIEIPAGVTTVGVGAFLECSALSKITLPFVGSNGSGAEVFSYVFEGTVPASLKTVIITGGNAIKADAFKNLSNITHLYLPASIEKVGDGAFSGCSGLTYYEDGKGGKYLGNDNARYTVLVSVSTSATSFEIPEGTKAIYEGAFKNQSTLRTIVIPESVKCIGSYAFSGCTALTNVTVPDSVSYIGVGIFSGCTSIAQLRVPFVGANANDYKIFGYLFDEDGVLDKNAQASQVPSSLKKVVITNTTKVADYAFLGLTNITSVTLPENIASIGKSAFDECSSLTECVNAENAYTVGTSAFHNCTALKQIVIGEGVTVIEGNAYHTCSSVTSLTIPNGVKEIKGYAFANLKKITEIVIPESVERIADYAFVNCTSLEKVTIPEGTEVEPRAFSGCSSLVGTLRNGAYYLQVGSNPYAILLKVSSTSITSFTVNANTRIISDGAFKNCSGLTSIVIPKTVETIGSGAFAGCSALSEITIPFVGKSREATAAGEIIFGYIFGASAYSSQNSSIPSSLKKVTINGCQTIGDYAFYGCTSITRVIIGEGVKDIRKYAFYGTTGITTQPIVLPSTVRTIGAYAFQNSKIKYITLNEGLVSIGENAFRLGELTGKLYIPSTVTTIAYGVFTGCRMTEIEVSAENPVFYSEGNCIIDAASKRIVQGCKGSVIPQDGSIKIIGANAFYRINLTQNEIVIPSSVNEIGSDAFGWSNIKSIVIPESVTVIANNTFRSCSSLTSISLPNSIEEFSISAFGGGKYNIFPTSASTNTRDLSTLYNGAKYLGNSENPYLVLLEVVDTSVSNFTIHENTRVIVSHAFAGCANLKAINIPDSVVSIGESAFDGCTAVESIRIGSGVKSIGQNAFRGCENAIVDVSVSNEYYCSENNCIVSKYR